MNKLIFLFFILCIACNTEKVKEIPLKKEYPNTVGDIAFDKELDDPSFTPCYEYLDYRSLQYYDKGWINYKGELSAIKREIFSQYNSPKIKGETGYLTVRFMVNCKGNAGLFRQSATDFELKEKKFNEEISSQLFNFTKKLNRWETFNYKGDDLDHYQYLTFKIIDSDLIEILP